MVSFALISNALVSCQVVEKVSVIVMDANDERPQFQNMPSIVDVPEVRNLVSENLYSLLNHLGSYRICVNIWPAKGSGFEREREN